MSDFFKELKTASDKRSAPVSSEWDPNENLDRLSKSWNKDKRRNFIKAFQLKLNGNKPKKGKAHSIAKLNYNYGKKTVNYRVTCYSWGEKCPNLN